MVQYSFRASETPPPPSNSAPIPAGWYAVIIEDIQQKPFKDKDGWKLEFKYRIDENAHPLVGPRVVYPLHGVNLGHPDPEVVKRAEEDMDRILHACGVRGFDDTDQLLAKRLAVRLTVKPAVIENGVEKWPAKNEVRGFDTIAARIPGPQQAGSHGAQSAASQGNAQPAGAAPSRSWRKS